WTCPLAHERLCGCGRKFRPLRQLRSSGALIQGTRKATHNRPVAAQLAPCQCPRDKVRDFLPPIFNAELLPESAASIVEGDATFLTPRACPGPGHDRSRRNQLKTHRAHFLESLASSAISEGMPMELCARTQRSRVSFVAHQQVGFSSIVANLLQI